MGAVFGIVYLVGMLVTLGVIRVRYGFGEVRPDWREFVLANPIRFCAMSMTVWCWPLPLALWLLQGRPGPKWRAVTSVEGREVRRIVRVR